MVYKFEQRYTEDDLTLDYLAQEASNNFMDIPEDEELPFNEDKQEEEAIDSMVWLNSF